MAILGTLLISCSPCVGTLEAASLPLWQFCPESKSKPLSGRFLDVFHHFSDKVGRTAEGMWSLPFQRNDRKGRMSKRTSKDPWPCSGPPRVSVAPLQSVIYPHSEDAQLSRKCRLPIAPTSPLLKSLSISFKDLISKIPLQLFSFFSSDHSLWVPQSKDPHSSGRTRGTKRSREKNGLFNTHILNLLTGVWLSFSGLFWNYKDRRMLKCHTWNFKWSLTTYSKQNM